MPFKLRKLNHSPQWYHDRFKSEQGTAPLRAMLTKDMKFIGADIDSTHTYMERVDAYEESWNDIFSGRNKNTDTSDLNQVLIREGLLGHVPSKLYTKPPFSTIARLMDKNGLTTTTVREFLNWTAKNENVKKARKSKVVAPLSKGNWRSVRKK